MALSKFVLFLSGLVWIGYGAWLFFDPTGLVYMGYGLDNWSAIVEVQAMYGAVEFMLGIYAMVGVFKPKEYLRPALLLWAFIFTGLVVGRIVGITQWDGEWWVYDFGAEGLPMAYNPGALWFYEVPCMIMCWVGLYKIKNDQELNG